MRKRIIGPDPNRDRGPSPSWIDLRQIATVEVSSEDPDFPIESVFTSDGSSGWRAAEPGQQTIRLIFDDPLEVRRLRFHFIDAEHERTQEFTVRWFSANGGEPKEIVRQRWNFSPGGSTQEVEDYDVNLENVSALELVIKPDLRREDLRATLAGWRVA
jgi:hypothetical protein